METMTAKRGRPRKRPEGASTGPGKTYAHEQKSKAKEAKHKSYDDERKGKLPEMLAKIVRCKQAEVTNLNSGVYETRWIGRCLCTGTRATLDRMERKMCV